MVLVCWIGYTLYADRGRGRPNLMRCMHEYRRLWMKCMLARDNRMVDTQIKAIVALIIQSLNPVFGGPSCRNATKWELSVTKQLPTATTYSTRHDATWLRHGTAPISPRTLRYRVCRDAAAICRLAYDACQRGAELRANLSPGEARLASIFLVALETTEQIFPGAPEVAP